MDSRPYARCRARMRDLKNVEDVEGILENVDEKLYARKAKDTHLIKDPIFSQKFSENSPSWPSIAITAALPVGGKRALYC